MYTASLTVSRENLPRWADFAEGICKTGSKWARAGDDRLDGREIVQLEEERVVNEGRDNRRDLIQLISHGTVGDQQQGTHQVQSLDFVFRDRSQRSLHIKLSMQDISIPAPGSQVRQDQPVTVTQGQEAKCGLSPAVFMQCFECPGLDNVCDDVVMRDLGKFLSSC